MKLHQLRYLCQIVDSGLNVTEAAKTLHTSQSGISRQIRLLEQEIGTSILLRCSNRITGLTEPGEEIVVAARRLLISANDLKDILQTFDRRDYGSLTVAMFQLHARFALLPTITKFAHTHPNVRLQLSQLDSADIAELVASRHAEIGIVTGTNGNENDVIFLPAYQTTMHLYAPRNHPVRKNKRPSLADVSSYPLIVLEANRTIKRRLPQFGTVLEGLIKSLRCSSSDR